MALAAGAQAPAEAQAPAAPRVAFDIPAQPLDTALAAFFRVSGVQLLYDAAITAGRRSAPVKGAFTPREALERLVAPSGIVVRYTHGDAAILTLPGFGAEAPLVPLGRVVVRERALPPPTPLGRLIYYRALEKQLTARLADDPRTARLAFETTVEMQINGAGRISEMRLARDSGSDKVDQALVAVLMGAQVPTPPGNIAQPLVVTLRGRRPE